VTLLMRGTHWRFGMKSQHVCNRSAQSRQREREREREREHMGLALAALQSLRKGTTVGHGEVFALWMSLEVFIMDSWSDWCGRGLGGRGTDCQRLNELPGQWKHSGFWLWW
jgi:hypothetical protein